MIRREPVSFGTMPIPDILGLTIMLNRPSPPQHPNRSFRAIVIQCDYAWALTFLTYQISIKLSTDHNQNLPSQKYSKTHDQVVLSGFKVCISANVPRQFTTFWDAFEIYLSKGNVRSSRIALRTHDNEK